MSQYILTYPIDCKIYYSSTPKKAAKKAFLDLIKYNNYNQSRLILKDNNTKKEYNYIGMTNLKLEEYKKLLQKRNPVQTGGNRNINDRDFYEKLSLLSENIEVSIGELNKILKEKYEPEDNNDIILMVKEGINKIDAINNNMTIIKDKMVPRTMSEIPEDYELQIQDLKRKHSNKDDNFCIIS